MKHNYLKHLCLGAVAALGLNAGAQSVLPHASSNYLMYAEETWGTVMGDMDGMTKELVYFYDGQNRLVRQALYGKTYGTIDGETTTSSVQLSNYYIYEYNDKGQLALTYSRKYGQYDGDDFAFKTQNDTAVYTYNEAGLLVEKMEAASSRCTTYEYDEQGNLVKESLFTLRQNPMQLIESYAYSDFVAPGCPRTVVGDGMYASKKFVEERTYDEANLLVKAERFTTKEETGDDGLPVMVKTFKTGQHYKYDATGFLTEEVHFKAGKVVNDTVPQDTAKRVLYTFDGGDENRVKVVVWNRSSKGVWTTTTTHKVNVSQEFNPASAGTVVVTAVEGVKNTVKTVFTPPVAAGNYAYDLYRDGVKVCRLDATMLDEATGTYAYEEKDLKNGRYEYYVRTVELSADENGVEKQLNVSNIGDVTLHVELPAPTNLRIADVRTVEGDVLVTLQWDAAADDAVLADLGFSRYNVMFKNMKVADNVDDAGTSTSWETNSFYTNKRSLYIQAEYLYGKSSSEMYTLDYEDYDPTGIEASNAVGLEVANGTVSVGAPSNITVFDAEGRKVADARNVKAVSLDGLTSGAYIIAVAQGRNVKVVKIMK